MTHPPRLQGQRQRNTRRLDRQPSHEVPPTKVQGRGFDRIDSGHPESRNGS